MTAHTIRTRLVQMEVLPGRPAENAARMLEFIGQAISDQVELIVFPEMAVPGYLIGDEWEHDAFLRECEKCCAELRAASTGIVSIFGSVGLDWRRRNEDGRVRKYNALFVAQDGRFAGPLNGPYEFAIKTLQPNYREFDDSRHFFDLRKLALEENKRLDELAAPIKTRLGLLGCMLCEDAWDMDYCISPFSLLAGTGCDLFVNISASPFTLNKNHKRNKVFSAHAVKQKRPLIYVNNVGIQNNGKTVFTFDGGSCVYDSHGRQVRCETPFEESCLTLDVPFERGAAFGEPLDLRQDGAAEICDAILYGTRKFMELCGVRKITVGASGGIDSAVVAALYSRILAPEDLLLVNMPSRFNSATTRGLARSLADNLGCYYTDIPIEESVALTRNQIDGLALTGARVGAGRNLKLSGLALENVQARDRSSRILAAVSAAFGGVFTCNANKSEATVGYTTLYGDLGGYLANIADLWKTEVYQLASHLNEHVFSKEVIPCGCMRVTPSAELSEAQNVDLNLGDPLIYPYHDLLFKSWIEWWHRATPEEILAWHDEGMLEEKLGYQGRIADLFGDSNASFVADLERWWNLYKGMGQVKRIQAPPVLAVKRRAFGFDHREAVMKPHYTSKYAELKRKLTVPPTVSRGA